MISSEKLLCKLIYEGLLKKLTECYKKRKTNLIFFKIWWTVGTTSVCALNFYCMQAINLHEWFIILHEK